MLNAWNAVQGFVSTACTSAEHTHEAAEVYWCCPKFLVPQMAFCFAKLLRNQREAWFSIASVFSGPKP